MIEAYSALLKFLDQTGMNKSAQALKEEMANQFKSSHKNDEVNKNIIKIINNALQDKEKKEQLQKQAQDKNANLQNSNKPGVQLLSQEQTENIMEKLMNKLVGNPNLLEDEKLNAKIEKFFDNQTFQRIVEQTDVFQEVSQLNTTNSYLQKNKQELQSNIRTENSNSWDIDPQAPHFGGQNEMNIVLEDSINKNFNTPNKQEIVIQQDQIQLHQQPQNQQVQFKQGSQQSQQIAPNHQQSQRGQVKQPLHRSIDELFQTEEDGKKDTESQKDNKDTKGTNQNKDQVPIIDVEKMPSIIKPEQNEQSSDFIQNSNSLMLEQLEDPANLVDEYYDDDDPGFDLYEVSERDFARVAKQLADKYNFPQRAMQIQKKSKEDKSSQNEDKEKNPPSQNNEEDSAILLKGLQSKKKESQKTEKKEGEESKEPNANTNQDQGQNQNPIKTEGSTISKDVSDKEQKKKVQGYIYLPDTIKHPKTPDEFYPVEYDKVIYDCFNLKVIYDRERTGFEETKDFPIVINSIIAGRYQIIGYLGAAAFSKAIQCLDLVTKQMYCMKVIENNKDYFDQSIDEIKLLKYINFNGNVDEKNCLKLYDYFYHKEHLFIVTELLKDNLYEFYKFNRENQPTAYFTIGRLQKITKQILVGLEFIHSLHLIHCDLKPENILMKSFSKCEVKIIDFGSSCFIHDHLSSYVQSRSYRAPEVIIGCKYDYKIDMWSLGCILAELWTGNVLFQNDSVQGLLARVIGIVGSFPEWMMKEGRLVNNFFTREKLLYQEVYEDGEFSQNMNDTSDAGQKQRKKTGRIQILVPKKSHLKARIRNDDALFIDFLKQLLQIDFNKRYSATQALQHPWIIQAKYEDGI